MLTFHKIIRQCTDGNREGWRAFVAEYSPLFAGLLRVYLGKGGSSEIPDAWTDSLEDLAAGGGERLRALGHQSEKEFLLEMRRLVLARAALTVPDEAGETQPVSSPEGRARGVVEGLPAVHQQVVLLKLTGYSDEMLEQVLRVTPGVAQQGFDRIRADDHFTRADWFRVLKHAWSARTENCPGARQFIRIQEGQVSWYDRDRVDRHLVTCMHCLELWTALAEVRYWRREAHPLTPAEAEAVLAGVQFKPAPADKPLGLDGLFKLGRS